jgi:hypothetical protein
MRPIVTLAATAGLALAPALAVAQGTQSPVIPDQEISKAGSALHDVAKLQQKYQPQMDSASPAQKQGLSEQANAEAVQAIQSHGLSVQEYSNVMRTAQTNPDVKQRLLQAARQGN